MRIPVIISALCLWLSGVPSSQIEVRAPLTPAAVMVDGVFSQGEWDHASVIVVPQTAKLYFQTSKEFVYIAIQYTQSPSGIVDMYVSDHDGEIYDLHASAKLGERQTNTNRPTEWTWWNNREWTANVSRVESFEKRSFLPAQIREYQIRRSRFPAGEWRLRFELTAMGSDNQTQVKVFPDGTSEKSTSGWLVLKVN